MQVGEKGKKKLDFYLYCVGQWAFYVTKFLNSENYMLLLMRVLKHMHLYTLMY